MVHLPHLGKLRVKPEAEEIACGDEEAAERFFKRFRFASPIRQELGTSAASQPVEHGMLDEPSPLGLRLKKSASFLDLIQMKLAEAESTKEAKSMENASASEKLKASNFPASLLRIGDWERVSRYEGDLVAKCYFAKHKLVWEVLDGGLKNKIEIQWSDISALKANCPENELGTLDIVLSRQPTFFRETNPQPRKHTLWQATSDFTGGQASLHRRHLLQCPQGLMNKHIEKLIHCDPRLYSLSQQPEIVLENPFFESRNNVFQDQESSKYAGFGNAEDGSRLQIAGCQGLLSPQSCSSSRIISEVRGFGGREDVVARHFSSSVCDTGVSPMIQENSPSEAVLQNDFHNWNSFKVPGVRPSMSKSDIMNHIGHHFNRQVNSGNQLANDNISSSKDEFDKLTQYLLSDSQLSAATEEKFLMSRVNSLCSLLDKDAGTTQNQQINYQGGVANSLTNDVDVYERKPVLNIGSSTEAQSSSSGQLEFKVASSSSSIARQDSMGDLLMHLPRIASYPHFL